MVQHAKHKPPSSPPKNKPTHPPTQQWPWAINMAGLPIWCTFGPIGAGAIGGRLGNAHSASEMSTARVTPLMRQRANTLNAVYLSATCGLAVWNRNLRPRLRCVCLGLLLWARANGYQPAHHHLIHIYTSLRLILHSKKGGQRRRWTRRGASR